MSREPHKIHKILATVKTNGDRYSDDPYNANDGGDPFNDHIFFTWLNDLSQTRPDFIVS